MPWKWSDYGTRPRRCDRGFKVWGWSTARGGCRFGHRHSGPCKPKGR